MNILNKVQFIAQKIGVKDGRNNYFLTSIDDPDNQCVKCKKDTSIALGCVEIRHLPGIVKEALRPHFSNAFAPTLDK